MIGSVCVRTKGRPFRSDRAVVRYVFFVLMMSTSEKGELSLV